MSAMSALTIVELTERFDDLVAAVERIADALEAIAEPADEKAPDGQA